MKDDRVYLRHIRDAIARIESYVTQGRDAFLAETLYAVRSMRPLGGAERPHHRDARLEPTPRSHRAVVGF
jgi:hypothetical protein